jgi:hypothetical protein
MAIAVMLRVIGAEPLIVLSNIGPVIHETNGAIEEVVEYDLVG